jgi:hypothetical protein
MKAKPALGRKVNTENVTTTDLFRLASENIERLGTTEGARTLFPNGFDSIDRVMVVN